MTSKLPEGALRNFAAKNGIDLVHSDLFDKETVAGLRFEEGDPDHVLDHLRAYQRLLRIVHSLAGHAVPSIEESGGQWVDALIRRNLTSAHQVAAIPEFRFVAEFSSAFGAEESARAFHRRAVGRSAMVKHLWANIKDSLGSPHFRATRFFNAAPTLENYFAQIPSYQDIFGGLNYIACPHCASILSPAAYFLDLMRIIDLYVTDANTGPNGIPPAYTLRARRPDLFTRKLDCRNTDEPVPFLSIVVDVLGARIKQEVGTDANQAVAIAKYPFNLPYNQPLSQVRTHLPQLKTTLYDIYNQFGAAAVDSSREYLRISAETYTLLATVSTTPEAVAPLYGYDTLDLNEIAKLSVFLDRTGLNRKGVRDLLEQNMTSDELAALADKFFINDTGESLSYMRVVVDATDPKNPFEKIANISVKRLDRLTRFIRLTSIVRWSYADADWAMKSVDAVEIEGALPSFAAMQRLRDRLAQPIDVTIALWYLVKNVGRGNAVNPQDLFDRVFNSPPLLDGDPYGHDSKEPFNPARPLTWNVMGTSAQDLLIRQRLIAALNVSDNDLTAVALFQACLLGGERSLQTDLETLTALYRLTRIPQLAKVSIPDYLIILRMMYAPTSACVDRPPNQKKLTIKDIFDQFDVIAWSKAPGFNATHLQYVITGVAAPNFDTGYDPQQIVPFVNALATLSEPARLGPSSFVFQNIDTDNSAELFKALAAAKIISDLGILLTEVISFDMVSPLLPMARDFAAAAIGQTDSETAYQGLVDHKIILPTLKSGGGALSSDFNAETDLNWLFPSDPNKRDQVRSILLQYRQNIHHTVGVLLSASTLQMATAVQGVAGFFGTDSTMMAVLVPFAAGAADLSDYLKVLLTPIPSGEPVPEKLLTLMATLGRGIHLLRMLRFTPSETKGALTHPAAFGIKSTVQLTLNNIRSLWSFKELTQVFKDKNDSLLAYLEMPASNPDEKKAKLRALANLTGWNFEQLVQLVPLFWPAGEDYGIVSGVVRLKHAFDLSAGSGLNIPSLLQLEALSRVNLRKDGGIDPAAWSTLVAAAGATLDAVNAWVDDKGFPDVLSAMNAVNDTENRDAFAPYLVWLLRTDKSIRQLSDLYQYLLIDVEMTSCDSVSYIAQGIASLQLYLQRCHLGIEPGVNSLPIPSVWWKWMSQYRVWEVNRKVFLYPENYVDPTLRGSRTPQFAGLQDTLLQSEVRADTVEAALRTYLDEFSGLAQLRIVGSYRFAVPDDAGQKTTDTIFFIGRSHTDPYTFYWRKAEHYTVIKNSDNSWSSRADWSPWRKINITIPVPFVTPVYAFGKLMLFWVEFEKVTSSIINAQQQSEDHTVWSSSLRYGFMDFRGSWVQAQTLDQSIVFDFIPDKAYLDQTPLDPVVFSPEQMYWQRVYVVHVPPQRSTLMNGLEQLLLLYGNQFTFFPGKDVVPINPCPQQEICDKDFPERVRLNQEIFSMMRKAKELSGPGLKIRGSVTMKTAAAIPSTLLAQNRPIVLLNSLPDVAPVTPYTGVMQDQTLNVTSVASVLVGDYYYDQTIPRTMPEIGNGARVAASGSSVLLGALAPTNTALWTVKNQPGWFIYDNGDDVFLVASQQLPLRQISDLIHATDDFGVYPPGLYVYTDAYTTNPSDPTEIPFAFTRLGTHTIAALSQQLFSGGIPALLSIQSQQTKEMPFSRLQPGPNVINTTTDTLDFDGAYGPYFWEIFFHSVFLIAERLRVSQHFDEARLWYQYVFDPTARSDDGPVSSPFDRYWRFLPFRNFTVESLTEMLTNVEQIARYNDDPFDPDAIARLRKSVYPKAIVMRYIDNLLQWGDALFSQDTRESITQATNLYVLASDLLGKRPQNVRVFQQPAAKNYDDIRRLYDTTDMAQGGTPTSITLAASAPKVDFFYNGLPIEVIEGAGNGQRRTIDDYNGITQVATVTRPWDVPPDATSKYHILSIPEFLIDLENTSPLVGLPDIAAQGDPPYNEINAYFCVPENDELIAYWDKVEDRLYKIRHCMNIQGIERPLALFEPPLDVRSVIQAAASPGGLNLERTSEPPIPFFRFEAVIERAKELTSNLIQLGSELLSALEAGDAEALNLLRTTQEKAILNLSTQIRADQVNAAIANRAALDVSRSSASARSKFYKDLIKKGLSSAELANLQAMEMALLFNTMASIIKTAAAIGYAVPQVGSPFAMTYGGEQIGNMLNAMSGMLEIGAYVSDYIAQRSLTMAGYERRGQDWDLQAMLADFDVTQINQQIASNDILQRIAERELTIHQQTILQNQELDDFFRRKFTSKELFQWMAGRLSTIYFQTYTLAFDLARAAQSAYQFETNTLETFIKFDYHDPTYRGLLAGEGLLLSLNQMQSSWANKRARTLEIEKTVSLAQLDPLALLALREGGECMFDLTERLFDLDFPGHYCRKIKTLSISIPAVVGPYQNFNATLLQQSNQIVLSNADVSAVRFLLGEDPQSPPGPDKLRTNWWINQQVAISTGLNDAGMFELNFTDPRYLPFEGTGSVSSWKLSMPKAANRIDFSAISDVVITLKYTALDGGRHFRDQVVALEPIKTYASGRLLLLSQQFSTQWFAFMQSRPADKKQTLTFPIGASLIPPHVEEGEITGMYLHLLVKGDADAANGKAYITINVPGQSPIPITIGAKNSALITRDLTPFEGNWTLTFDLQETPATLKDGDFLNSKALLDVALILYYKGNLHW